MKCKVCVKMGVKSKIYQQRSFRDWSGSKNDGKIYYDEDGKKHRIKASFKEAAWYSRYVCTNNHTVRADKKDFWRSCAIL